VHIDKIGGMKNTRDGSLIRMRGIEGATFAPETYPRSDLKVLNELVGFGRYDSCVDNQGWNFPVFPFEVSCGNALAKSDNERFRNKWPSSNSPTQTSWSSDLSVLVLNY